MKNTNSTTSLEKRIKRHIIGKTQTFFAATSPGLENICLQELKNLKLNVETGPISPGGVEFTGRLKDCYLANLHLRTANRILMRITEFKATNFTQLEKKIRQIPWELYFSENSSITVYTSCKNSRLYHNDAISERIKNNINLYLDQNNPIENNRYLPQKIFVRVINDRFSISIDSSGELLHKRGIKKNVGKAPMRETIAAAALMMAQFNPAEPLIDPMCGSGTFSIEAALISQEIPPGYLKKDFAFMGWPSFKENQWNYLKKEAEKHFSNRKKISIFASDLNSAPCNILRQNIDKYIPLKIIEVEQKNFFNAPAPLKTKSKGLVIINPPYGVRLGSRKQSKMLIERIADKLKKDYQGWKLALFIPDRSMVNRLPFNLTPHILNHGGVKLTFVTGVIS